MDKQIVEDIASLKKHIAFVTARGAKFTQGEREISSLLTSYEALQVENERLKANWRSAELDGILAEADTRSAEAQVKALQSQLSEREGEVAQLHETIRHQDLNLNRLQARAQALQVENERLKDDVTNQAHSIQLREQEADRAKQTQAHTEKLWNDAEAKALALQSQLSEREGEVERANANRLELLVLGMDYERQITALEARANTAEAEVVRLTTALKVMGDAIMDRARQALILLNQQDITDG